MARKLIIDLDPGIGDAFAAVLALLDPQLDVLALTATAGCVTGRCATQNVQAIVDQIDPGKWPRIGTVPPHDPARDILPPQSPEFAAVNGSTGLGDFQATVAELHHPHESSKLLVDLVRTYPHEVTLLTLGPLSNVAAACERAPDFLSLVDTLVCLGGAVTEGGDVTAAAEFNIAFHPEAARHVLCAPFAKMLIPLDVTNKVMLTFEHFNRLTGKSRGAAFLRQLLPFAFRAYHQFFGLEGVPLREVTALAAISQPHLFRVQRMSVDIETRGELTRGMTVFDRRHSPQPKGNVNVAIEVESQGVLDYLTRLWQS